MKKSDQPFTVAVAPILVAFTLPTIALIVTSPVRLPLKDLVLALLVASTGVLLAGLQFAVGTFSDAHKFYDGARATLTSIGLTLLGAALTLLLWPLMLQRPGRDATDRGILCAGLVLLTAGILVPIGIKLYRWTKPGIAKAHPSDHAKPQPNDLSPESVDAIVELICRGSPAERRKALTKAVWLLPDLEESDRSRLTSATELLNALDNQRTPGHHRPHAR
jgi:hypothetical protein